MAFRTGNPALSEKAFSGLARSNDGTAMTLGGTVNKTFLLLALVITGAVLAWRNYELLVPYVWVAALGAFLVALPIVFKKHLAPALAPLYAFVEGIALGTISAVFEMRYPGIVLQAVGLTFGVLFVLLGAYRSGWIRATDNLKLGVTAATGAVALYYLVAWVLGAAFHMQMPLLHDSGWLSIGFSVFIVGLAALNLVLDFDFIEVAAAQGAPKYMEWYGAFGLVVTLVWLYLEILRLFSKLSSRR